MKKMNLTLMLLLFAVISFAQNVPPYVPTNGLVGWWPFNGNANDESGNGINCNPLGVVLTTDRFGIQNSAYSFNGSSNVINCGNSTNPNLTLIGDFTISAWINASCFGCNNYANTILSKHRFGSPNGYIFGLWNGGMINYQGTPNFDASTYPSGQSGFINTNIWKNVTVIYQSAISSLKYFINGNLVDNKLLGFNMASNNDDLVFGAQRNGAATGYLDFFSGKIDDIGVWNRALDSSEVVTLFTNSSITGFNPLSYENTIKIWPNPSNSQITIDAGDLNLMNGYSIRIVNALGQQMFQTALTQQQYVVNLATWTGPGLYYVNIINPQGVTIDTKKIVIQ